MTTYFTTVSTTPGLNRLPVNPCKLLDFAYLTLNDGERSRAHPATARCWR